MNKKALYESIMKNVSIEVKKVLNENFNFEPTKVFEAIIAAWADKRLENIIADVACEDIKQLICVCKSLVDAKKIPSAAAKRISTIEDLAGYILVTHFNKEAIDEFKAYDEDRLDEIAESVCKELGKCECEDQSNDFSTPADNLEECGDNLEECGNKNNVSECNENVNHKKYKFRKFSEM